MKKSRLSGTLVFFRFVWPCAEEKFRARKISQSDFSLLRKLIRNGRKPRMSLLKRCFPNPFRDWEIFSRAKRTKMTAVGTVVKLLRYHHGHDGDCAGRVGKIDSIAEDCVFVVFSGKLTPCFNIYCLELEKGDEVLVHRRVVVKEIKKARRIK